MVTYPMPWPVTIVLAIAYTTIWLISASIRALIYAVMALVFIVQAFVGAGRIGYEHWLDHRAAHR